MRIIDADALANNITILCEKNKALIDEWLRNNIEDEITDAPTIEAEPVRHGHWKRKLDTRFGEKLNDIIGCSECNIYFSTIDMIRRSYCPNCGAKMDEVKKNETN